MKRAATGLVLLLLASGACVPRYDPPRADEPHAVIKLRRTYDTTAGNQLSEEVDVNNHNALRANTESDVAKAPRMDAILAHPLPSTFVVRSGFYHFEMRVVLETYQSPHTVYETQSYDCSSGFGTNVSHRTCTRSVPRTTYEEKQRTVTKSVRVSDGECESQLRFAPLDRHAYLLQYTYQANSVCTLSCFEQIQNPDGTFTDQLCPSAPPAP